MSIINKMHQDFQQVQQEQPILASMPKKKGTSKTALLSAIILLTASSLGLSYLIFTQDSKPPETAIAAVKKAQPVVPQTLKNRAGSGVDLQEKAVVDSAPVKPFVQPLKISKKPLPAAKDAATKEKKAAPEISAVKESVSNSPAKPSLPAGKPSAKNNALEIKTVKLSNAQLAHIHLKEADKAEADGKLQLAAKKRGQALALLATLNEVRKSLALYYYGQGNIIKASRLLRVGALVSPDYSDFNLMLSRIALKAGDNQKAYLYLEQNPPQVEGNLDYYVSHAILAQKFQKYEQSEKLYTSLLSQRPNNGRWRMALAIAQDKQAKAELAISSYKKALLQADLSSKAKAYIDLRLTYLEQK